MTESGLRRIHHDHNAGWSRDLFTDVVSVQGNARTLYFSGVCAEDPASTDREDVRIIGEDFESQTRVVFDKLTTMLAAHGGTLADVVRMTTYVTDADHLSTFFRVQGEALAGAPRPPHSFLVVAGLAVPELLVEVEVTAVI